jgi:hypothetical protein
MTYMSSFPSHDHLRKVCALSAAALILPVLAFAGTDNGQGNNGQNNGNQYGKGKNDDPPVSAVPEANAGWVLIPFFGIVLLFSARQLFRGKATE